MRRRGLGPLRSERFTLPRNPDLYKRPVKCPNCKSLDVYSVEAQRRAEIKKQKRCYCGPVPFPHRKASMKWCVHHPENKRAMSNPTEEEKHEYQAMLETKRSN